MGRPLEQVVSGFLRPPLRKFRGAEVERLALAKDAVSVADSAAGDTMAAEGRVSFALTGYSQVGASGTTYVPNTSSTVIKADSSITVDTWGPQ